MADDGPPAPVRLDGSEPGSPVAGGDERSWVVPYRVRFDEAGPDGLVRPGILLAYAQDCAWLHSTALGIDRAWYRARGLAWLVRAVRLDLRAPIESGSELLVRTTVIGFRAASARRRTDVTLGRERLAVVLTDWALTDERGRPVRLPAEVRARFARVGGDGLGGFRPLRVVDGSGRPAEPAEAPAAALSDRLGRVRRADTDPMGHLNNSRALDLVEEAIADLPAGQAVLGTLPRRYLLEYRAPLPAGSPLDVRLGPVGDNPGAAFNVEIRAAGAPSAAIVAVVEAGDGALEEELG